MTTHVTTPFTQAAFLTGHGGNEVVQVGPRDVPALQPGQVRVRMRAATLNQVDLYMRNSGAGITHSLPQTLGLDGAGVVEAVADDVHTVQVGQSVVIYPAETCGHCEFCERGEDALCMNVSYVGEHRDGTFTERLVLSARNVFPMPTGLRDVEAAALGVTHLTAWRMLVTKARLQPWETVLIFGVGGGVSLAALQLAKQMGARVWVTSRHEEKLQRALVLGADHAIDTRRQDVVKEVMALTQGRGVDVVIENVGTAVWSSAMRSLVRGGRLVTCGATSGDQPPADIRRIFIRQLQILGSTLGNRDEFRAMLAFCERTGLRPLIDSEYPLAQVHQALTRLSSGEQFGKVCLSLEG